MRSIKKKTKKCFFSKKNHNISTSCTTCIWVSLFRFWAVTLLCEVVSFLVRGRQLAWLFVPPSFCGHREISWPTRCSFSAFPSRWHLWILREHCVGVFWAACGAWNRRRCCWILPGRSRWRSCGLRQYPWVPGQVGSLRWRRCFPRCAARPRRLHRGTVPGCEIHGAQGWTMSCRERMTLSGIYCCDACLGL